MDIFRKRPLCVVVAVFILSLVLLLNANVCLKIALIILSCLILVIWYIKVKHINLFIALLGALLLSSIISLAYFNYYIGSASKWYGQTETIKLEIIDVNYSSAYSSYAEVKVLQIGKEKVNFKARFECTYSVDAERGEMFAVKGKFSDFENNDLFNSKRYYNSKGYYLNILSEDNTMTYLGKAGFSVSSMFKSINEFCEARLKKVLDEESFGFANGIFLGNRENIDPKLNRDFTELGISHMIAISGMHLTILIGSIYSMLLHFGLHRKIAVGISIAICVFYVGMTGATPAILRSGIMFIIMSLSTLIMRENDSVTSLFATAGIIIFIMPNAIFDAAFLLSCFSTFGILIISPKLKKISEWAKAKNRFVSYICGIMIGVVVTTFATVFTLPLTAFYFGRFYYLLPLTNLIFEIPTTLILMLSPFVVVFSYVPFVGNILAYFCKIITLFMTFIADAIASLNIGGVSLSYPFVSVIIIVFIAIALIMVVFEIKNPFWIFLPFAVSICAYIVCEERFLSKFNSYDYVCCQNSVRNDMMIVHSLNQTSIIDISYGGRSSAEYALKTAKDVFYDAHIESYVLTHFHNYHPGTIDKITQKYYIDTVYLPVPNGDDVAIAETIYNICLKNNVNCVYYDSTIVLSENNQTKITTEYVKRSKHPVVLLDIDLNGYVVSYQSPASLEYFDFKELPGVVFFGLHGPKIKSVEKSYSTNLALYADRSIEDSYHIQSEKTLILDDVIQSEIIRIKH